MGLMPCLLRKDLILSVGSDHLNVAPINSELQHLDAVVADVEALHEQRGQSVFKQVLNHDGVRGV